MSNQTITPATMTLKEMAQYLKSVQANVEAMTDQLEAMGKKDASEKVDAIIDTLRTAKLELLSDPIKNPA